MTLSATYLTVRSAVTTPGGFSSLTTSTGISAAVGDYLVAIVGASNSGTNGASAISSMTDAVGNTWTLRHQATNDPGAVDEGCTYAVFTCNVTNALSSQNVTLNFSPNCIAAIFLLFRLDPTSGYVAAFNRADTAQTGNGGSNTKISSSMVTGELVFGIGVLETNGSFPTFQTADVDTTRGSWSSVYERTSNAQIHLATQFKTVTGDGTQSWTYDPDRTGDYVVNTVIFDETFVAVDYNVAGDAGAYAISGQDVSLLRGTITIADAGAYLISGEDAVLSSEPTLNAVAGSYLISGGDANFRASGQILASSAAYTISGQDATFAVGGLMIIDPGSYEITGQNAQLELGSIFVVNAGSYLISGTSAQFVLTEPSSTDIQDIYRRNFSKMPFWRAVRAKELLWPKWKF